MTTLNDVTKKKAEQSAEQKAAVELVRLAQEQGLSLTGPDGLLKQLTKTVLETALNEEMTEHLGYEKHDPPEAGTGNVRNGTRAKTVLTDTTGAVEIDVPRDRSATFEPQIVKKRQRRLSGVDEVVLSLYAKGFTTGEISAHFAEIYGASVSKETVSRITDKVLEEMNEWTVRPLDATYAAIFIDAISGDGPRRAGRQPPVLRRDRGHPGWERDILGLWAGTGGEGAKFWMAVLTDLRNRGVTDTFFVVCDGLKGLPEVVADVWPQAIVQTCIIHLLRNTFRLTSRKYWDEIKRDVKPIYTAVNATAARSAFDELDREMGEALPGGDPPVGQRLGRVHSRSWTTTWRSGGSSVRPMRSSPSMPATAARSRPADTFPSEQAALKCLYLVTRSLDPTGVGRARWTMRWKPALECVRNHLRRPIPGSRNLLMKTAGNTVNASV